MQVENILQKQTKGTMRRVYAVWFLRRATRPAMMRFYIVSLALVEVGRAVSLPSVLTNMSEHDAPHLVPFVQNAFTGTELVVQAALLAALVGGAYVARDVFVRKELFLHSPKIAR